MSCKKNLGDGQGFYFALFLIFSKAYSHFSHKFFHLCFSWVYIFFICLSN